MFSLVSRKVLAMRNITLYSVCFFNYFIKNPQNTIALPFLTHNISATGGVYRKKCLPGSNFEIFRFISSLVSVKTELKPVNFNFLVPLHHAIFEFNEAN